MKNVTFLHKGTNRLMSKVRLIEEELWIGFYLDYMQKLYDSSSNLLLIYFWGLQIRIRKQVVHKI